MKIKGLPIAPTYTLLIRGGGIFQHYLLVGVWLNNTCENLPMTELVSTEDCGDWAPNAQMHCELPGTWNFEKLHLELKYFGKNDAEARLKRAEVVSETSSNCRPISAGDAVSARPGTLARNTILLCNR